MTGRIVAFIEWGLAAVLVVWFVLFLVLSDVYLPDPTLGVTVTSVFFAPGLAVSLAINGAAHFFRPERLGVSEHIFLGIEALLIALLVTASLVDQANYGPYGGISAGFGHWLEWFVPVWVVIGPIALVVLILALVKRKPRAPVSPAAPAAG